MIRDTHGLASRLRGHMPVLDGLRGLAILLVLAHRFNVVVPRSWTSRALAVSMEFGWVGVQLFFVLSGFLITGILLDTKHGEGYYRSFFARRVLRIFPLYYTVLVVAFMVLPLAGHPLDGRQHQLWLWTYLSNWAAPFGLAVTAFPHFWSLAVEEQFYLVWPWLVRAVSGRGLAIACGALVLVAVGSRVVLRSLGASPELAYQLTPCRADALALGALAAWALRVPAHARLLAAHRHTLMTGASTVLIAGAVVTHYYPRLGLLTQTLGYTLLALVCVALLVAAVLAEAGAGWTAAALAFAPLRSLGKYSYGMYVFHVPLHQLLGVPMLARLAPEPTALQCLGYAAAMTAVTLLAAVASYYLLERPFLRLKRRFSPSVAP